MISTVTCMFRWILRAKSQQLVNEKLKQNWAFGLAKTSHQLFVEFMYWAFCDSQVFLIRIVTEECHSCTITSGHLPSCKIPLALWKKNIYTTKSSDFYTSPSLNSGIFVDNLVLFNLQSLSFFVVAWNIYQHFRRIDQQKWCLTNTASGMINIMLFIHVVFRLWCIGLSETVTWICD